MISKWRTGQKTKEQFQSLHTMLTAYLPFASVSKRVYVRKHSYENVFHLQFVDLHANQTHFHMKRFARGLVLKHRHNYGSHFI